MKRLILAAILALPATALATDFMEVIEFELQEGCSFSEYMGVVRDFNEWAKDYGYRAEIAMPLHSSNLTSLYWMGRAADAATFGTAWDIWRDSQSDANSVPAKLQARFSKCSKNVARSSYDVY